MGELPGSGTPYPAHGKERPRADADLRPLSGPRPVGRTQAISPSADASLPDEIAFLAGEGFPLLWLHEAASAARRKGLSSAEVLVDRGMIARDDYERRLAASLGASWERAGPSPDQLGIVLPDPNDELRVPAVMAGANGGSTLFISPQESGYGRVAGLWRDMPGAFARAVFTSRRALRRAVFERARIAHAERATRRLAEDLPQFSASRRLSAMQAVWLALSVAAIAALAIRDPARLQLGAAIVFSLFYLGIVLLRLLMIVRAGEVAIFPEPGFRPRQVEPEDFPVYSILAPLRNEAGQVADLISALDRLDWPATRREVFLICEEDDAATPAALRAIALPEGFELVICPPGRPRTKPKALQYALTLCSGEFVAIYDAEDRPDPMQLREAWETFSRDDPRLVCVQAPLLIDNAGQNWLTRMFAIEYLTQFLGTLAVLEHYGAPLPLGGTSNHFRTAHLRAAGGWDPYNVTEDADLGIRLARLGYRCGTISSPTWEEAPPVLRVWHGQRSRWLKGWLQTILVHSRNPLRTAAQLGLQGTLFLHLILTAIVVSMLIHPVFLVYVGWQTAQLAAGVPGAIGDPLVYGLAIFNLAGGYTTYGYFAYGIMRETRDPPSALWLLTLPLYWLLISSAGWRALGQLLLRPFCWEKTPHGLAKNRGSDNI